MTKDGCTRAIKQDPYLLATKYISEPMSGKKICYGFHRANAYTFLGQDVDFSLCPSDSRKAVFLEGHKLQNNMFSGAVYLNPGDQFIGVVAEYMPEMYVVDAELHLSLFSESMECVSFLAPAAGTVKIYRSNISYVYQNTSAETYGLFETVDSLLLQSVTLYGIVDNAKNTMFGYLVNSSSGTDLNDTTVRAIAGGEKSGMVLYASGSYLVNNSILRGYVKSTAVGYLFYVAGAGVSTNVVVQNTLMGVNFSSSGVNLAFYGVTVYMANIQSTNVTIYGKRNSYSAIYIVVSKKHDTTQMSRSSSYYCT